MRSRLVYKIIMSKQEQKISNCVNKSTLIIVSIIVILLFLGVFLLQKKGGVQLSVDQKTVFEIEKAPDFSLKDYSGKTVKLADFHGKSLVINSWAAWCPFCKKELVDFVSAQNEFSAQGGGDVIFIAINRAESREVAKKYSDELGVTNGMLLLLDPGDSFFRSIGGFSMPETIFVDVKGNIVFHKRGPMDAHEIREKINQLLQR